MRRNSNIQKSLLLMVMFICFSCSEHRNNAKQTSNEYASNEDKTTVVESYTAENVKTQYVRVKDVKYAYRIIGDTKKGMPLVMLTRFRANMDDWDPLFLNELAKADFG